MAAGAYPQKCALVQGACVARMLFGGNGDRQPGLQSDGREGGADDWSFTVDELLRVTAARPVTKQSRVVRGNTNVIGFISDTSSFGGGDDYVEDDMSEWPPGPISTIHLTLGSIDDRPAE